MHTAMQSPQFATSLPRTIVQRPSVAGSPQHTFDSAPVWPAASGQAG